VNHRVELEATSINSQGAAELIKDGVIGMKSDKRLRGGGNFIVGCSASSVRAVDEESRCDWASIPGRTKWE